jgi:hypothetical protein
MEFTGNHVHLVEELLRDGEDDWVMIDNLIAYAWEESERTGEDPKRIAVQLLKRLLPDALMEIGDLGSTGFEAWTCSLDETVKRFVEGCESYGWEPQGALWWLNITPKGRRFLQEREGRTSG